MKPIHTDIIEWSRRGLGLALTTSLFIVMLLSASSAATAQPAVIHVYESGAPPYVGAAGIMQALSDIADPGTIYIHSGTYDLGNTASSFLSVTKALTLVGWDDGYGRPLIKGGRPAGTGFMDVIAPDRAVTLENLEFSFYGTRPLGSVDVAVSVRGSNSFTVQNCMIIGAYYDGSYNQGLYASFGIEGFSLSEFPNNPNYPHRYNVRGEIKFQNSTFISLFSGISIGVFGPVSMDRVEVTGCTITALGPDQIGDWNKGNFGIMMLQYPVYMNDANRSALIEATHSGTQTIIGNNSITAPNGMFLLYLKGLQTVERNRIHSPGMTYSRGRFYQLGILAAGYPHDMFDSSTYSEAIIRDNVISLEVPPFPIPAFPPFVPPQTAANTFPPTGIWLGITQRVSHLNSGITGHYATATVANNIISSNAFSPTDSFNYPDYGIYLDSETKNCTASGNALGGGFLKDPIDNQFKWFNGLRAKNAELLLGPETHDNTVLANTFGAADVTGIRCFGHNNNFINNHFFGNYIGWEGGPGLFWLTDTSYGNGIVATKLNSSPYGINICGQIRDETATSFSVYNGLNIIPGLEKCGN